MKTYRIIATTMLFAMAISMAFAGQKTRERIIFETDMGNDIDDALALDMLYKYHQQGRIHLMAIMLNKEGEYPCQFIDIMNTWYRLPNIPIGIIHNGAKTPEGDINYTKPVALMKDELGHPIYKRSLHSYSTLPDAHLLYRKLLAKAPDHSVTIVSVGFSTNLARLLDTKADRYSKLSGRELIARKVKRLITMGGDIEDSNHAEYNIVCDIPSARHVFSDWPTPIITSAYEVGHNIHFPGSSIQNDFRWTTHHPVVDAYWQFRHRLFDSPTWDLTSVLYAVEGTSFFGISPSGELIINEKGLMTFEPSPLANRHYLTVTPEQRKKIKQYFMDFITSEPKKWRKR